MKCLRGEKVRLISYLKKSGKESKVALKNIMHRADICTYLGE